MLKIYDRLNNLIINTLYYSLTTSILFFGLSKATNAQIISDNFDTYTTGALSSQSEHWTTWAGDFTDDGIVVDTVSNTAPNSLLIGNFIYDSDVLLLLGNKDTGSYSLDYNLFIPSGKVGYYNFQEDEIPGVGWNLDVFFNEDGLAPGVGSFVQSDSTFTYPQDEWFTIHQVLDLDANLMSYYINDSLVFDNYIFDGNLGAIDFWSISDDNELYIDDVVFDNAEPLSSCPFPTIICDNFDSYTTGVLGPQSDHWTTWSGTEGGAEDGMVDTNLYNSAPNSMLIDTSGGGPADVVLLLGNKTTGSYSLDFNIFIPAGRGGYYNIQEDEVPGVGWNLDVYFNEDGAAPGVGSFFQLDSTFNYPEDEWFAVHQVIDLDANLMSFWINGNIVFNKIEFDGNLGAIDFFALSENHKFYIDDVVFAETDHLIICPFQTMICDDLDDYSTGALGPQSNHWTTWSGTEGGEEDGIVTKDQWLSYNNSLFIDSTGVQNVLLLLGNLEYENSSLEFDVYIPYNASGYFNIQYSEIPSEQPNSIVYFNRDGISPGIGSFNDGFDDEQISEFEYPEGQWFSIKIDFGVTCAILNLWVNESYVTGNFDFFGAIGAVNFRSHSNVDGSNTNQMYIDNVVLYEEYWICGSVNDLPEISGFKLYPNPSDGHFTITSEKLSGDFNLDIIDISGRVVFTEQIELLKNEEQTINTSDLNTGVYILRMVDNATKEVYTTRVSIQ